MKLDGIPLFSMLKGRLHHLGERQRLISENVANADTPGFTPRDLKTFTAGDVGRVGLAPVRTQAAHLAGSTRLSPWKPIASPDSETTLDGNSVVLEEEMIRMGEARADYDAAISFYQKSLNMLRMAARAPGR